MMKVVRLKGGYRVTCNATEFEALKHVAELGMSAVAAQPNRERLRGLAGAKLRTERFIQAGGPLATIDDNRLDDAAS